MTILVVLPGLDGTATMHAEFVGALRSLFDAVSLIAYPQNRVMNYAELEVLVRAALPASIPFVLLGESFSGPIAISIAAQPPGGLVGLILSTSFARAPVRLLSAFAPLVRFAPVRSIPQALLWWWLLGRWATPPLKVALRAALDSVESSVLRARAAAAVRVDVTTVLAEISMPTLLLRATEDRLLSRAASMEILSAVRHAEIVDIAGPHLLLQANPLVCAQAVIAFAGKLSFSSH